MDEILDRLFPARLGDPLIELFQILGGGRVILIQHARRDVHARVFLQQLGLLGGPFVGGGLVRFPQHGPLGFWELEQFLFERRGQVRLLFRVLLDGDPLGLGIRRRGRRPVGVRVQRHQPRLRRAPALPVERRLENRPQPIVVGLRNRVVAVVVALGAVDGQAEQRRADNPHRIGDNLIASQVLVGRARARSIGRHPQEPRRLQPLNLFRGKVRGRRPNEFVASQLLQHEPIDRQIGVHGSNHIVAELVRVSPWRVGTRVAVRIGIAGDIQPVAGPALAMLWRSQQPIEPPFVGVRRTVLRELFQFFASRRQTDQVERRAPQQCGSVGGGRHRQAAFGRGIRDEPIDWSPRGDRNKRCVGGRTSRRAGR